MPLISLQQPTPDMSCSLIPAGRYQQDSGSNQLVDDLRNESAAATIVRGRVRRVTLFLRRTTVGVPLEEGASLRSTPPDARHLI